MEVHQLPPEGRPVLDTGVHLDLLGVYPRDDLRNQHAFRERYPRPGPVGILAVHDRYAGREDAAPLDLIGDPDADTGTVDRQTGIVRQLLLQPDDALSLNRVRGL